MRVHKARVDLSLVLRRRIASFVQRCIKKWRRSPAPPPDVASDSRPRKVNIPQSGNGTYSPVLYSVLVMVPSSSSTIRHIATPQLCFLSLFVLFTVR
ncbi:hypothetical protein J6590_068082 [Homalodisca vitripennis]|nr:hypothetical protein J6590_068082 [Homalodisca vitripennis]